ncbi:protein piccolo-like [Cyclopterus lumpus]|uniref:protein piccolo-like n=1 Tax=Cyclopterus lumpus TaxID=8103 RepID=UPI00148628D5|nr:protein piccolo-like [Cyclopterus lumpus]
MAYRESRGREIVVCFTLLVVARSFCHCARLTKLKAMDELRGNSTLDKGQSEGINVHHGRLLIGQTPKATKNLLDVDADHQKDMGWSEPMHLQGWGDGFSKPNLKPESAAIDRLLKMDPKVECTGDSMTLQVQDSTSSPGSLFFVDRGSRLSPLPLSKLPPSCGYSIRSTLRDLVLVAPYDGCFVTLEEDCYVLLLRWLGLPVRMSCPLMRRSSPNPPMVACHAQGMVVKMGWTVSIAQIKVNLFGNWEPLMKASTRCGFSVVVHPEGVVISVSYAPCLEKKDEMYTLELTGEGETLISCPSLSPGQTEHTRPTDGLKPQTETPRKGVYPSTPFLINPTQSATPQVTAFIEEPSAKPPVTQQPTGQDALFYPYPFYVKPPNPNRVPPAHTPELETPENLSPTLLVPKNQEPLHPEAPRGHVKQHLYLFPFYPQPEPEKPTAAPEPSQPEATLGQVEQPLYPFPFYPRPEPEKPTAASRPPQPEATRGKVEQPLYPYLFNPQPEPKEPTAASRPPQPEATRGQVEQPLYPFPFYPRPEPEKPTAASRPPQPEATLGKVEQPFYPYLFYPQPEAEKPTAASRPSQPEATRGQVEQPLYPFPFYTTPEPEKPTAASRPPQPEATRGQVEQPLYPFPFYPRPEPEKPTAASRPSQPEATRGQVEQPLYPFPFYTTPEPEKPTAASRPPQPEATRGNVEQPFYPYLFYPQPEPEKPTAASRPPQPEATLGQVEQPLYPFPFYPRPEPEKPTAASRPSQPEATRGQVEQPLYPFPFYTTPEPEKPTAASRPPQPEATLGQVEQPLYPFPFYPQPEPEKPTAASRPPQPEATRGNVEQPFYPYLFYPQPEPEKPTAASRPPQPEATRGQVEQPLYPFPFYPRPEPEKPTAAPRPPQPEATRGQVEQPLYPFPFYTTPEPEKPTAAPRPPQPEATRGQVEQPFYPYLLYPQPEAEKPTAASRPSQPEATRGQVEQPLYPFPFYTTPEPEKPTAAPRPPQPEATQGQVEQGLYPYLFYPQPKPEKPTAAPSLPQPDAPQGQVEKALNPFPFYSLPKPGGIVPQDSPVYCPQFCPSEFLNCCPQISYHHHLHQIIPFVPVSQDAPSLYPGPLYLPSGANSGFGNGLSSAPLPQEPTEVMAMQATMTSISAPISNLSLQSGNEKMPQLQPPDGNLAALPDTHSKPTNPEWTIYQYVPNSLYPNWPYLQQNEELQNLPRSISPASYNVPSNPQAPSSKQGNPVLKYDPYTVQPTKQKKVQLLGWDMNNPSGSYIGQYLQQHIKKQQMPQAHIYDKLTAPNMSQLQPLIGSKQSTNRRATVHSYSEPKSNVLLQQGPPGREPNYYNDSPLPSSDLVHDSSLIAQTLAKHQSGKNPTLQIAG